MQSCKKPNLTPLNIKPLQNTKTTTVMNNSSTTLESPQEPDSPISPVTAFIQEKDSEIKQLKKMIKQLDNQLKETLKTKQMLAAQMEDEKNTHKKTLDKLQQVQNLFKEASAREEKTLDKLTQVQNLFKEASAREEKTQYSLKNNLKIIDELNQQIFTLTQERNDAAKEARDLNEKLNSQIAMEKNRRISDLKETKAKDDYIHDLKYTLNTYTANAQKNAHIIQELKHENEQLQKRLSTANIQLSLPKDKALEQAQLEKIEQLSRAEDALFNLKKKTLLYDNTLKELSDTKKELALRQEENRQMKNLISELNIVKPAYTLKSIHPSFFLEKQNTGTEDTKVTFNPYTHRL